MNFNSLMKNKYLHYFAMVLMVINVLGYVSVGSIECVLVLGGAAYLANHFTKNRTADIFIGLFVSNVLFGCGRIKEGMESGTDMMKKAGAQMAKEGMSEGNSNKISTGVAAQSAAEHCDEDCKRKKAQAQADSSA